MFKFLFSFFLLGSLNLFATVNVKIPTPRGSDVNVQIHAPAGSNLPALIIAPGASCNSKGPLFESLGVKGIEKNFAVFRFEWSYCETSKPTPSDKLKNEIEDMAAVLEFTKTYPSIDPTKIIIAGKSMGSGVAYKIFLSHSELKAIALLTPICSYTTDDNNNPLPAPVSVCDQGYPNLKDGSRPVLMTMGNKDDACVLPILFDFLKDSKGNIQTFVAGGDHGFRIFDAEGKLDSVKTQNNINTVSEVVLNWMNLVF